MSSQKDKVQKYAGFDVGAHAAQSTHSVCLISVFFVHFVYLLGRFNEVNIGYQPPLPLYKPTFINLVILFLFLSPCVIYCAMTFYYFLCYCIVFLHTYPYKHVHMLCFFLNCLILLMFPIVSLLLFWMKGGIKSES